jgi:predicted esterase
MTGGRLTFRPTSPPPSGTARTGRFDVEALPGTPPAAVYVPPFDEGEPLRLVVSLHGAGGTAASGLGLLRKDADRRRLLLLAPKSTARSWDVIRGGFGPDVRNVDHLLAGIAASYPVRGLTIAGFSDGATYALSLGLTNGDLFDSVLAFSPGFNAAKVARGRPGVFVSHGTDDEVLRIDRCSRRVVPVLRRRGYDVTYFEFGGGHWLPVAVRREAMKFIDGLE